MSTQTKEKNQNNQTENEFFALVETGRKGVEGMLQTMAEDFKTIGATNVSKQYSTWAQRALVYISSEDSLSSVIQSKKGIYSIYKELAKAAQMGLQIGGHFPHAYLMPFSGGVALCPTWEGYAFAAVYGPGAVLEQVPKLVEVYEKDKFRIQEAEGEYTHDFSPFEDRGKLAGFVMKLVYKDGRVEIPYVTIQEVTRIINGYSNTNSPAFKKAEIDMVRKTAAKKLLKKPAKEAEGLAMMYQSDADQEPVYNDEPIDITDRVSSRLDNVIERTPEPKETEPEESAEPEPEPEEAAKEEEESGEEKPGDLF